MLGIMRKNAGSWVVKFILGGIALIFALSFGTSSFFSESTTVFKVNGQEITEQQVEQEMETLYQVYSQQYGAEVVRQLESAKVRERARDNLLNQALLQQAAAKLGIKTMPEEVIPYIEGNPQFQKNGVFNFELYQANLRAMGMSPEQFELGMQNQLTLSKLAALLSASATVSDNELTQFISSVLTRIEGAYLVFKVKDYLKQVTLTPEEIEAYYQAHKNEYMEPPQIRFAYIKFSHESFLSRVTVTDEEISQAYENRVERFVKPENLSIRSIALHVPPRADESMRQQLKEKANLVLQEARAAGADFVALAKRYDQDVAGGGGKLWSIKREDLPAQVGDRLFSTPPGQVDLLEIPTGFMVVKVESYHPSQVTPLAEVRAQLKQELELGAARLAAKRAASQSLAAMHKGETLEQVAGQYNIKPGQTALMGVDETLPDMPATREVWDTLLGLSAGQAGVPLDYAGGVVLPVLLEQKPAVQQSLEQAKSQVELALTNNKAADITLSAAQAKIAELKGAANPGAAMLAQKGVVRFGPILASEEIKDLPGSDALRAAMFNQVLSAPVVDSPLPVLDGIAVGVLLQRSAPGADEIAQNKESQRANLLREKQAAIFEAYLQDLREQAQIENGR